MSVSVNTVGRDITRNRSESFILVRNHE